MRQEVIQKAQAAPKQQTPNLTGIPTQMKLDFERHSGLSFDDVRVHYHSDKPARLGALAYTQGTQVHIGPGQERHLRHELGHVVQQKLDLVRPTGQRNGVAINDAPGLERAADHLSSLPRLKPSQDRPERQVYRQSTLQRAAAPQSQPVQMVSDEDIEGILENPNLGRWIKRAYRENPKQFLEQCNKALMEYWKTYHTKGPSFEEWKWKLDFYYAFDIIQAALHATNRNKKWVLTIGDQGLATARRAQRSGFKVIATAMDFNENDKKVKRRRDKLEKLGDGFRFFKGMRLTDDGKLVDEGGEEFNSNGTPISLAVFDHPYTTGIVYGKIFQGSDNDVAKLCKSFFRFASNQGIPRIQMTVRGVDAGKASAIRIYKLWYPGFYLYRVQPSQVKEHLTTNPSYNGTPIIPRKQSLVFKYVNLMDYFFPLFFESCWLKGNARNRDEAESAADDLRRSLQRTTAPSEYTPAWLEKIFLEREAETRAEVLAKARAKAQLTSIRAARKGTKENLTNKYINIAQEIIDGFTEKSPGEEVERIYNSKGKDLVEQYFNGQFPLRPEMSDSED